LLSVFYFFLFSYAFQNYQMDYCFCSCDFSSHHNPHRYRCCQRSIASTPLWSHHTWSSKYNWPRSYWRYKPTNNRARRLERSFFSFLSFFVPMLASQLLPLIKFFDVSEQDWSQLLDCLVKTWVYDHTSRTIIHHHHRLWADILGILSWKKTLDEVLCLGTEEGRPFIVSQYHHYPSLQSQHYLLTFGPQKTERALLYSSSYAQVYAPLADK